MNETLTEALNKNPIIRDHGTDAEKKLIKNHNDKLIKNLLWLI